MLCRSYPLFVAALAMLTFGVSGCKTIFRDTYTWKKNYFVPPPAKETAPVLPEVTEPPVTVSPVTDPTQFQSATPLIDPNAEPGMPATEEPPVDPASMPIPGL